jgi:hypothetical protein
MATTLWSGAEYSMHEDRRFVMPIVAVIFDVFEAQ